MEISFILSSLWLSGGVRVVIQYANRLAKRGHHISFVIPEGTVDSHLGIEIDPSIRILQAKTALTKGMNPIKLGLLAWEMAKVTPKSDVIIATHTPTTSVSMIAGKLFRKGKIVWFYQDYQEMFEKRPLEGWLLRNAARWHDMSLTISEACIQELRAFSNAEILNVGEGLDTQDVFHPIPNARSLCQVNPDQKVILTIGDSRPRKGMADFLEAVEKVFSSMPDIVLWIVSKENMEIQTNVPMVFIIDHPQLTLPACTLPAIFSYLLPGMKALDCRLSKPWLVVRPC